MMIQVNDLVEVKTDAGTPHDGQAGIVQAIHGDKITVKLDLADAPADFTEPELIFLGR